MKTAIVLTDGKAGHENQSKAFAAALGCEVRLVEIHFRSRLHKALSYLFDHVGVRSLSLYDVDLKTAVAGMSPSCVIGTGSGTFYAVKSLASHLKVKGGVVLYPRGYRLSTFDCILAPAFDRPKAAPNVIEIPANLVVDRPDFYAKGVEDFLSRAPAERSLAATAVIVGGPNRCSTLTADWMRQRLDEIFAQAKSDGHRTWVTTSRRTPPEVEAVVDSYPWDYRLIYSRDHFNPIPAFVKLAKRIYVTAESTGMLSETCTFGEAEVRALDNLKSGDHKFRRFVDNLRAGGYLDGKNKIDLSQPFAAARQLMEI